MEKENAFHEIISSVDEISPLLTRMMEFIRQFRFPPAQEKEIKLAAYEGVANAVEHGTNNNEEKRVFVSCFFEKSDPENLIIVIRDEGPGFDPDAVPDPRFGEALSSSGGRGVYLMRQLMDEVAYFNGGREVRMRKLLKPE